MASNKMKNKLIGFASFDDFDIYVFDENIDKIESKIIETVNLLTNIDFDVLDHKIISSYNNNLILN